MNIYTDTGMIIVEKWLLESREDRRKHLDLAEPCLLRGGYSTNHRGILAQYLNTDIPKGQRAHLCHACNNSHCSNPKHIYWGSPKDNVEDQKINGTFKHAWENTVAKYGIEEAKSRQKINGRCGAETTWSIKQRQRRM